MKLALVDPKTVFELYIEPKNSPLGSQKFKDDPKIKSKSKVRIEGNIENESCSSAIIDPKTVFELNIEPENSPLGSQKFKDDPKIKSKSKVRVEGNIENEGCLTT